MWEREHGWNCIMHWWALVGLCWNPVHIFMVCGPIFGAKWCQNMYKLVYTQLRSTEIVQIIQVALFIAMKTYASNIFMLLMVQLLWKAVRMWSFREFRAHNQYVFIRQHPVVVFVKLATKRVVTFWLTVFYDLLYYSLFPCYK